MKNGIVFISIDTPDRSFHHQDYHIMLNTTFTTCHPDTLISAITETTGDGAEKSIEDLRNIITRRSANGKRFGKLEITAQPQSPEECADDNATETDEERNSKTVHYLTAFVLDISSSMSGPKIVHARNTIIKFLEVLVAEAAAVSAAKIKTWFYLITFNDRAKVVVPLQEVTELSVGPMIATINKITASGSTSYEAAFYCNLNYLRDILDSPTSFASASASPPPKQLHIVKFFETDGDITAGCSNLSTLYQVMHEQPTPHAAYKKTLFTYEDCVFGYGADVDTKCLKTLAAPHPPIKSTATATSAAPVVTHCSNFCSIGKPEDIGWQVGELLFKLITRCGAFISVSVSQTADAEGPVVGGQNPHTTEGPVVGGRNPQLFEYQTHTWNNRTTLHSIAANETKTIFVQFDGALQKFDNSIEMTDQITGRRYKYKFRHEISTSTSTSTTATTATTATTTATTATTTATTATTTATTATTTAPNSESDILSMILGMMQIEIFKLMREMEADSTVYDADTLVTETYKMMRILKCIKNGQILIPSQQPEQTDATAALAMTPEMRWLENLITDAKVLIGLTTINAKNEQLAIIHARRTSSAEHEFFSTGQKAFGEYIDGEEFYEQAAKDAISEYNKKMQEGPEGGEYNDDDNVAAAAAAAAAAADNQFYEPNDCIPSRIATASHYYSQCDAIDTPYPGGGGNGNGGRDNGGNNSVLRTLCARFALAIENKEDITIEEMCKIVFRGEYDDHHNYRHNQSRGGDDTFSSIPDDEHSSRRVRMMRQMSTPMSSA